MTISLRAIRPRRFNLIDPLKTDIEARAGIREYLEHVKRQLQDYPPEHVGQRYVRTYKLQRGWKINIPSRYYGDLYNEMPYAGVVQGVRGVQQVRFRRWGWESITDIARRTAKDYHDIMNRRIRSGIIGES